MCAHNSESESVAASMSNVCPAYCTTYITVPGGNWKWVGGVLVNGKIFCPPRDANSVLIIDPVTLAVDDTTISVVSGAHKWHEAVYCERIMLIVCPPKDTNGVLLINPWTNETITGTHFPSTPLSHCVCMMMYSGPM